MERILEIGSHDVNGSLTVHNPEGVEWVGVDINPGPGVDLVIEPHARLPFPDGYFDLVMASSVFEHDTAFWKTLEEMARVVSDEGFIYINAPSNGVVHRYPLDVFRFYPDAGLAFLTIVKEGHKPSAHLVESLVIDRDQPGGDWNDFVAVIGGGHRPYRSTEVDI